MTTAAHGRLQVVPLTPALADAWVALFHACGSSCFCRYWHFEGTKNEWLERLASDPSSIEREQRALVAASYANVRGLVALDGDAVVGWVKLAPRATMPKLRRLPVYRALDLGTDDGVMAVGCLLVDPSHRRRGVSRALLLAARVEAERSGARALEAYPHRRAEALRDEELWMGPLCLYESLGFKVVAGDVAYPVLRLTFEPRVSNR